MIEINPPEVIDKARLIEYLNTFEMPLFMRVFHPNRAAIWQCRWDTYAILLDALNDAELAKELECPGYPHKRYASGQWRLDEKGSLIAQPQIHLK